MRTRTKVIAAAAAAVLLGGFGWYQHTGGQVFAPLLGWHRYTFAGNSMEPTMHDGDVFYCEPLGSDEKAGVGVGEIVVVEVETGRMIAKRVAAQAGDTIEGRDGELLRNGEPEFEALTAESELFDFAAATVPDGHLFVIGDNFDASRDSRDLGPIPYPDVQCLVHR